jgi:hypothetical protein
MAEGEGTLVEGQAATDAVFCGHQVGGGDGVADDVTARQHQGTAQRRPFWQGSGHRRGRPNQDGGGVGAVGDDDQFVGGRWQQAHVITHDGGAGDTGEGAGGGHGGHTYPQQGTMGPKVNAGDGGDTDDAGPGAIAGAVAVVGGLADRRGQSPGHRQGAAGLPRTTAAVGAVDNELVGGGGVEVDVGAGHIVGRLQQRAGVGPGAVGGDHLAVGEGAACGREGVSDPR